MVWPYDGTLDLAQLAAAGWTATPFNEFVCKVETRCNLNCDYCYVYNLGDDSWRSQPPSMSEDVARAAATRIREHALSHGLRGVLISIHGGEPLLRGVRFVERFVTVMRHELGDVAARFSLQTNATRVTADVAARLAALEIGVGVSLDGDIAANHHRLDLRGRSTFDRVVDGIRHLQRHDGLLQGLLCVIDLENDPVAVLDTFRELDVPSVDFLLPHGTWEERPPGKHQPRNAGRGANAPYGEWLARAYRAWTANGGAPGIRIFEDIANLVLGGRGSFEGLGLEPATLAVIEADGAIELVDHVGIAYRGAELTGASVFTHSLDDLLRHPGVVCRQLGTSALDQGCQTCPAVAVCGGGLITHRYASETGFMSPTVYCSDLYTLITVIEADLRQRLAEIGHAR